MPPLNLQKRTPGIGLAGPVRETDTASAAARVTPPRTTTPAAKPSSSGAPQFADNPFGAVGLILSNIAAGMRGQELPTTRIRREQAAEKQFNLRRLQTIFDLVEKGVGMFGSMDLSDPRTIAGIDAFAGQFTDSLGPDFRDTLISGIEFAQERGQEALKSLGEHQERAAQICGFDKDCILKVGRDPALMKQFDEAADRDRRSGIIAKFQAIGEAVKTDPNGNELLAAVAKDGITSAELRQIPEGFQLTEDEILTLERDKELQDIVRPAKYVQPHRPAFFVFR